MFSINGGVFQSSTNFSNLAAGTYRVTVRDADNIEAETSIVEIVEPTAINLGLAAGMYTVTVRDANGTIVVTNVVNLVNPDAISTNLVLNQNNLTINASGGTGIYTYSLDGINYQNSNQFTQLENGNYTAYILDSNECLYSENFSMDFISLSADFTISGENLCTGCRLHGLCTRCKWLY